MGMSYPVDVKLVAEFSRLCKTMIVIEERRSFLEKNIRDGLFRVGITHTSAGSHTEPGGYEHPEEATGQFEVADARSPEEVAAVLRDLGYDVVWEDWARVTPSSERMLTGSGWICGTGDPTLRAPEAAFSGAFRAPQVRGGKTAMKKALIAVSALLMAAAAVAQTNDRLVVCESINNTRHTCRVNFSGGIAMTRQLSDNACIRGQSWGINQRGIWVDKGCRAEFSIGGTTTSSTYAPPMGTHTVLCESKGGKTHCPVDTAYVKSSGCPGHPPCAPG